MSPDSKDVSFQNHGIHVERLLNDHVRLEPRLEVTFIFLGSSWSAFLKLTNSSNHVLTTISVLEALRRFQFIDK